MSRHVFARFALAVLTICATAPTRATAQQGSPGWLITGRSVDEYDATIDRKVMHTGAASVHVKPRIAEPSGFVSVMQAFRVEAFQGRTLHITAWRRTRDLSGNGAYLYVTITNATSRASLAYANSQQRATVGTSTGWILDSLSVVVPANATVASVGLIVDGAGEAWMDDVAVSIGPGTTSDTTGLDMIYDGGFERTMVIGGHIAYTPTEPPRAVSARGLDAMVAFAKLAGYVRFFHPSDSVVATDWHRFLSEGLKTVESATTPDSLVRALRGIFAGVAPTMRIDGAGVSASTVASAAPASGNAIAFWTHQGVRVATATLPQSPYSSKRIISVDMSRGQPLSELLGGAMPDPDKPYRIDLGNGISAVMPIALRVPLPNEASHREAVPKRSTLRPTSPTDRFTRLAAVAELWMVMETFYPYWDVVKTDWTANLRTGLTAAAADATLPQFDVTLKRMVAALKDGHGNVSRSGSGGAYYGVVLRMVEGDMMITRVMDSTRTDVQRGDIVLEIDGQPAKAALAEKVALISSATPQWAEYKALAELMNGRPNSTRRLRVRSASSANAPVRTVVLSAGQIAPGGQPDDLRPVKIADLAPGVLYVHMGKITDAEFVALLPRLQAAQGIVFDLRGYPSFSTPSLLPRLADSTIRSARFEVPNRSVPGSAGVTYRNGAWELAPILPRIRAKVAFLTDGRAVSYAESTMGIVEAYKLGEIVGEPTAGTNGNINPFTLPGGYSVTWTGMRVTKNDGSVHHGVGIKPTVPVSATKKGVLEGRDEQLERALEIVRNGPRAIVP